MNKKIVLNNFLKNLSNLSFGEYILFQEYTRDCDINSNYKISKPILAIYLGSFFADQTLGFNYVKWINPNHIVYITNEHITRYPTAKEVESIDSHIEWIDYIDILGIWKNKPTWKEIINKYRKLNLIDTVSANLIDFENMYKQFKK